MTILRTATSNFSSRLTSYFVYPPKQIPQMKKINNFVKNSFFTNVHYFSARNSESLTKTRSVKNNTPLSFEKFIETNLCNFDEYKLKIENFYRKHSKDPEKKLASFDMKEVYELYCHGAYNGYANTFVQANPHLML